MTIHITKEHVYVTTIPDRPGAIAEKLEELAACGLNLEFIVSRRDQPGRSLLFISPLRTIEEIRAARDAGFDPAPTMRLRVEGPDRAGIAAQVARTIADAGINLRAVSAASINGQQVMNFAFDAPGDVDRAKGAVQEALG
jgi:hypothetical protein